MPAGRGHKRGREPTTTSDGVAESTAAQSANACQSSSSKRSRLADRLGSSLPDDSAPPALPRLPTPELTSSIKSEENDAPFQGLKSVASSGMEQYMMKGLDIVLQALCQFQPGKLFNEVIADQAIMFAMRLDEYKLGTLPGVEALVAGTERLRQAGVDEADLGYTAAMVHKRLSSRFRDWAELANPDDDNTSEPATSSTSQVSWDDKTNRSDSETPAADIMPKQEPGLSHGLAEDRSPRNANSMRHQGDKTIVKPLPSDPAAEAQPRRPCNDPAWRLFISVVNKSVWERRLPRFGASWDIFRGEIRSLWKSLLNTERCRWEQLSCNTTSVRERNNKADALFQRQRLTEMLGPALERFSLAASHERLPC